MMVTCIACSMVPLLWMLHTLRSSRLSQHRFCSCSSGNVLVSRATHGNSRSSHAIIQNGDQQGVHDESGCDMPPYVIGSEDSSKMIVYDDY